MKRLTINRLAGAGIRADRRGYRSLAIGIFLSIFMITALVMSAQGIYLSREAISVLRMGYADCLLLNDHPTDEEIRSYGLFDRLGHIYVSGKITDSEKHLGWYDEEGAALMNRQLVEGHMPEQPGEIALERSALGILYSEATLGDTITLSVTPIDGVAEERAFTIVGLLTEQVRYMDPSENMFSSEGTMALPSILTCAEEPPFATGRTVTHRALTLRRGVTLSRIARMDEDLINKGAGWSLYYLGAEKGGVYYSFGSLSPIDNEGLSALMLLALLGLALVLSTCVGIAGAMDGQLARKREQIGLLRCVGATRRQIRRVFGREAWLLALLLAPAAVIAGCLFAWLLSLAAPGQFVFAVNLWLLIPILLLSMLCILISSGLPLRRAAQVMPMGVLRDTELLRKSRRLRSKEHFRVPRLIAVRQLRLHPTRQIGSALLVALMLFMMALGVDAAFYSMRDLSVNGSDFTTYYRASYTSSAFGDDVSGRGLSEQDLAQIRALPGVARVDIHTDITVNLVRDSIGEATKQLSGWRSEYLLTEEEYRQRTYDLTVSSYDMNYLPHDLSPETIDITSWKSSVQEYRAAHALMGLSESEQMINLPLQIVSLEKMDLSAAVTDGDIDLKAINEGREVLVYAPDSYYARNLRGNDLNYTPVYNAQYDELLSVTENNDFSAGEKLRFDQFWTSDMNALRNKTAYLSDYDSSYRFYEQFDRQSHQATVGAVLKGKVTASSLSFYDPCLITTPQGAKALGLALNPRGETFIYMEDDADEETINMAAEEIEQIVLRTDGLELINRVEIQRENDDYQYKLITVLFSIGALFFAVSVSMITGSVTRRIRADARMIGMLRAVGADERALRGCYSAQVTLNVLLGMLLSLCGWALLIRFTDLTAYMHLYSLLAILALAALCLICCHFILRLRVKEITRHSIVENIREL